MDFISTQRFGSQSEEVLWRALKTAFAEEPGYCWHRFPITNMSGSQIEPDIVILHPTWGLNIIEVKGCLISNIEEIEGHIWYMNDWYDDEIEPIEQAQGHMWAIIDRMKRFRHGALRNEDGNCRIFGRSFVGVPFITEQEWVHRFSEHISAPKWELVFSSDLEPQALRRRFENTPNRQKPISDEDWKIALAILQGSEGIQRKVRRPTKRDDSRGAWLRKVEQQMSALDLQQHRVAIQIPDGPQRIRGLAGSGKTVVLAQKAAYLHVKNPDWDIVLTFYSRSLYDQVRNYITRFVQQFSEGEIAEPNWNKIRIWHGWGANNQQGLYREISIAMHKHFMGFTEAQSYYATNSGRVALDSCCADLLVEEVPELFDAILVDEAQDFGKNFFRLCYQALRSPKRLVWGYDEVQSLEDLEIPTAETLFGKDAQGIPIVDLDGEYPGEIEKDMILFHCYRNPRPILVAAHAFGLGLLRKGGAIQFIDTVGGWRDIGYHVEGVTDNQMTAGQMATICRPIENSPHLLEKLAGYNNLVSWNLFNSRDEEISWIIDNVVSNIENEELKPDEIAIIALDSRTRTANREYELIKDGLEQRGIKSVRLGTDTGVDTFRVEGSVTITSAFRAKGNEASMVYVYGFEDVGTSYDVVKKRNKAFTAMTRTKGWLVISGVGRTAEVLFQELEAIMERVGCVSFIVPDMAKIQRNLETHENQRRRSRAKKAQESLAKLLRDLTDVNPDDLSEEQKKQLYRLLFKPTQESS
jgi:superfamily I DNA and RNA helicase